MPGVFENLWRFEYQYDFVPHVPVGKLMYANYQGKLRDENLSASYPERFKDVASKLGRRVLELIQHPSEAKEIVRNPAKSSFFIEQHAQYLPYLEEQSSIQTRMTLSE